MHDACACVMIMVHVQGCKISPANAWDVLNRINEGSLNILEYYKWDQCSPGFMEDEVVFGSTVVSSSSYLLLTV